MTSMKSERFGRDNSLVIKKVLVAGRFEDEVSVRLGMA
jgi:hypothetical protein